jgi:diphthine synthase
MFCHEALIRLVALFEFREKAMLKLLGLGLSADTITVGVLKKIVTECDVIFVDSYTSVWFPDISMMLSMLSVIGKTITVASRRHLEGEGIRDIIKLAQEKNVCIAVVGDPLIATTHSSIIVEAISQNIDVEVVPSVSVLNATISFSCLQSYRFGKMATVVSPKNGITYEYPYDVLKMNRSLNLHTLLLLEIDLEKNYFMKPYEALSILLYIQSRRSETILSNDDIVIVMADLTSCSHNVWVTTISEVLNNKHEFSSNTLYTIIIPAKRLHPIEEECLKYIRRKKLVYRCSINDKRDLETLLQALLQRSSLETVSQDLTKSKT